MKQIILVRHGQGVNNLAETLIGSWSEVELTDLGVKQAEAVAERLADELQGDYTLYSSDTRRAKHTAEIICERLDATPKYAMELREHYAGVASGMKKDDAMKLFVHVDKPSLDHRPWPESESWREFYNRVASFMDKLSETEERVLIVSHGGTIHNVVRWWIDSSFTERFMLGFGTANTSVTVLDVNYNNVRRIERLNDTSHYALMGAKNPIKN